MNKRSIQEGQIKTLIQTTAELFCPGLVVRVFDPVYMQNKDAMTIAVGIWQNSRTENDPELLVAEPVFEFDVAALNFGRAQLGIELAKLMTELVRTLSAGFFTPEVGNPEGKGRLVKGSEPVQEADRANEIPDFI